MKIIRHAGALVVVAPALVGFVGKLATGRPDARGLAVFPIIFVRAESYIEPWLINHERIHFRQSIETLFIGLLLIGFCERLYARVILKMTKQERYLYSAAEQEAYRNQNNLNYLRNRPFGNLFLYLRDKRPFTFGTKPGEIKYLS